MAVSIRNVEKFLNEHPEIGFWRRLWIGWNAARLAERRIISGGVAEKFMGPWADDFFREALSSPAHIQIGLADMEAAHPECAWRCTRCGASGTFELSDEDLYAEEGLYAGFEACHLAMEAHQDLQPSCIAQGITGDRHDMHIQ